MSDAHTPEQTGRHGVIAKSLHWGFLALFAFGIFKQAEDVAQLADAAFLRSEVLFALIFLGVLAARFFYMRLTGPTAVPSDAPAGLKRLSKLGHLAIYGALALIPVSGLSMAGLYAAGIASGPLMSGVLFLHEASVNLSFLLIGGHILAALYHRWKGDGIWSAMVPVWQERVRTS